MAFYNELKNCHSLEGIKSFVEDLMSSVQEREQAREELKKNKDLLQSILDNTPAVIYLKDQQGQYLLVNRRYETLFHIENKDIFGKTDADLFPKEIADAIKVNDQKVLTCLEPQQFEEEILQADGLHTYVSVKFPLYQNGLPYAVAGISTDITKRKQAEQKILRLNDELEEKVIQRTAELSQFKATLDVTLDAICMVDVKTLKFTYFNQGFINLTGAPFLNRIRQLAKSFKEEEICELLEECLKTK